MGLPFFGQNSNALEFYVDKLERSQEIVILDGGGSMYLPREEGQGLVEYALILVLVAVVVIAILTLLGPQVANIFSQVTNGLGGT
jgi:pilus assembly protein Flp/PilA